MSLLHLSSSPHIHSGRSTRRIMLDVIIALLPAFLAGVVIFGLRAAAVVLTCVASCVLSEAVFNLIIKKKQTVGDLSAVVTGLLLGLNMPANLPIWQAVIGSMFAIIIVKCFFGGIGCNLVNPAITARVFMLIAFGSMTKAAQPLAHTLSWFGNTAGVDAVAGATPLAQLAEGTSPGFLSLFFGTTAGAIGETCAVALLLGGIYLLVRRVITWHIPVCFVATVFVLSFLFNGFDLSGAFSQILSGGLFLGAIFMATDYVTSPPTVKGKVIFAVGAGLFTALIRFYGSYPEGVSFAILLMNILNPYICAMSKRKVFGGDKA